MRKKTKAFFFYSVEGPRKTSILMCPLLSFNAAFQIVLWIKFCRRVSDLFFQTDTFSGPEFPVLLYIGQKFHL